MARLQDYLDEANGQQWTSKFDRADPADGGKDDMRCDYSVTNKMRSGDWTYMEVHVLFENGFFEKTTIVTKHDEDGAITKYISDLRQRIKRGEEVNTAILANGMREE